jgi:FdhD protein
VAEYSGGKRGVVGVAAFYFANHEAGLEPFSTQVVEEDALTVDVEGVGRYMVMWTPTALAEAPHGYTLEDGVLGEVERPEALALAMGFALSEGIILSLADLRSVAVCADNPGVVRVQLHEPAKVRPARKNVVINSSCGICGPREILKENALGLHSVPETVSLRRGDFAGLIEQMRAGQAIFDETGGCHAAAIFDGSARVLAVAEDLGRHNALDKVIGTVLLERGSLAGCGVVLSSRLSLEMVLKAIRAGLEIMVAVSAPTSLAVEVADRFGVTLCGFVRETRATVYTHPQRIR